jgi:hypothetical protein
MKKPTRLECRFCSRMKIGYVAFPASGRDFDGNGRVRVVLKTLSRLLPLLSMSPK